MRHQAKKSKHWGRVKAPTILQTLPSFSRMKNIVLWVKFQWSLFPMVQSPISQHQFRKWLVADQATNHYLNKWRASLLTHMCVTRPRCFERHQQSTTCAALAHDDDIYGKHFPRYWLFVRKIHRSTVDSPHKGQWCGALMFSLIRAWTNAYL